MMFTSQNMCHLKLKRIARHQGVLHAAHIAGQRRFDAVCMQMAVYDVRGVVFLEQVGEQRLCAVLVGGGIVHHTDKLRVRRLFARIL